MIIRLPAHDFEVAEKSEFMSVETMKGSMSLADSVAPTGTSTNRILLKTNRGRQANEWLLGLATLIPLVPFLNIDSLPGSELTTNRITTALLNPNPRINLGANQN